MGVPMKIQLSVLIPVYRGGTHFSQCLSSVISEKREGVEILVVVDGCGDEAWREAEHCDVRILKLESNSGPAAARNYGACQARGEFLFFVDADVTIPKGTIDQILRGFEQHPEIDAMIGSYDDQPAAPNFISQYKHLLNYYVHQTAREEASTFWGACGAIRRDFFLRIGGFDEYYGFPSIEDIELGYRLRQNGGRIRLLKSLQVKHLKRWTPLTLLKSDFFNRALPWTALSWQKRYLLNDLNLKLSSRFSVFVFFLFILLCASAIFHPVFLGAAGLTALILLQINYPLYSLFKKKHGWLFMLKSVVWHWLYFFYCGVAFAIGTLKYFLFSRWIEDCSPLRGPIKSSILEKTNY
jgi:GT2 family glycosyltransferase